MTVNMVGDVATDRAGVESLRRRLGAHLALCRTAAGVTQPDLARAIGKTRSMISRIEHGTRVMSEALWKITDEVCRAQGALIAEYHTLAEAEQDYRAQCRAHRFQMQHSHAQTQLEALTASPASSLRDGGGGGDVWPEMTGADGELAGELMAVVMKLVRSMGRRQAMQLVGYVLAIVGLSGLDTEDYTRLVQALEMPRRVDTRVVESLAVTLAQCKRLEDTLGPCEVLDTVVAQHQIVRRLLKGGCPDTVVKPLKLVDSTIASTIGTCLINMDRPEAAKGYFAHARRAGHAAGSPACAAYAAANASFAAFLRGDTPAALDTAAAARSLAARTDDRLKALAEQMAAAAYALDGQYGPCMSACARAQDFLAKANEGGVCESLAYWVHEGTLDSQRSLFLCLLDKPTQAVEAACNAQARFDRTFVGSYGRCQVRLGHALMLSKDITQATHVLGHAANHASLSPRLTTELHTVRALMQPWKNAKIVKELDAKLETCGLVPARQTKYTTPESRGGIQWT